MQGRLPDPQLQAIRQLDTCTVADAIATLKIRLRNQGYSNRSVRCWFETALPMVGYAATGRIRSSEPPMVGSSFIEREDWFKYVLTIPEPRIVVLEDVDSTPGVGAFWDEVHARIHLRLGCIGAVTNGAVRDLPRIRPTGFYLFAGNLSAARGYAHIIDMGQPVEVGGMGINPGDLIHGDVHGVVNIPSEIVPELREIAGRILGIRERVFALCASPEFSLERLMGLLKDLE